MRERDVAEALLTKYWSQRPIPVRPEEIAAREGLRVEPFVDPHSDLSGEYCQVDGTPVIRYSKSDPAVRQRFTIAHELGHHMLSHGPRYRDTAAAFAQSSYDPVEVSANRFAAELLMPKYPLKLLVIDGGITSLAQLASSFEVSEVAMNYRLRNLGLI